MAQFFIDRPIFAWVIALFIVVLGGVSITQLPIAQYPSVAPRPVRIGSSVAGQWVVLDGLKPGEQVMVDGFQKLRGNAPVKPVPWKAAASGAGAASAASAPASTAPAASAASAPASAASR